MAILLNFILEYELVVYGYSTVAVVAMLRAWRPHYAYYAATYYGASVFTLGANILIKGL